MQSSCPVRWELQGCSRNLLAQGALITLVGLIVCLPRSCLIPESQIKVLLCSSGRLLNHSVNFVTTKIDVAGGDIQMKLQGLGVNYSLDNNIH